MQHIFIILKKFITGVTIVHSVLYSYSLQQQSKNSHHVLSENQPAAVSVGLPRLAVAHTMWRALKGGSYFHFPAQILTKSHHPAAQIPSSQCLSCSNFNPIPIFYCFFVDESQSQCMKSHFPSQKWANPSSHFTPSGPSMCSCKQSKHYSCEYTRKTITELQE